jgi:hypothetical protein
MKAKRLVVFRLNQPDIDIQECEKHEEDLATLIVLIEIPPSGVPSNPVRCLLSCDGSSGHLRTAGECNPRGTRNLGSSQRINHRVEDEFRSL